MGSILLIVQAVVCTLLIVVVLFQRSDSDGLSGLSGGSGTGIMSSRSKANFFTRLTAILAVIFMVNSLLYSVLISRTGASSELDKIAEQVKPVAEKVEATGDVKTDAAAGKPAGDAAATDKDAKATKPQTAPSVPLAN